jgi:hypothetical protein
VALSGPILNNFAVPLLITCRQTSFWEFLGQDVTSRVHFRHKAEWHNDQNEVPSFEILDEHPLLIDYTEPWGSIYVARPAAESEAVVRAVTQAVVSISGGWRDASAYLNDGYAHANLEDGSGQLMRGPLPYIQAACAILDAAGVRYSQIKSHGPSGPKRALIAGRNWVVAESFRVSQTHREVEC